MEVRTSADALKALLGVSSPASPQSPQTENADATRQHSSLAADRATLSLAGAEVVRVAEQMDIRTDRVAAIQRAIASGNYSVPAMAVAGKVMDSMLSGGVLSGVQERGSGESLG